MYISRELLCGYSADIYLQGYMSALYPSSVFSSGDFKVAGYLWSELELLLSQSRFPNSNLISQSPIPSLFGGGGGELSSVILQFSGFPPNVVGRITPGYLRKFALFPPEDRRILVGRSPDSAGYPPDTRRKSTGYLPDVRKIPAGFTWNSRIEKEDIHTDGRPESTETLAIILYSFQQEGHFHLCGICNTFGSWNNRY